MNKEVYERYSLADHTHVNQLHKDKNQSHHKEKLKITPEFKI